MNSEKHIHRSVLFPIHEMDWVYGTVTLGYLNLQLLIFLHFLPQSSDLELLLPRDSVCVPVQPIVVVKSESEPTAISFMGALRIPVSCKN